MAKVVILSGAGISAESGIGTFRESGGLWEEYDVKVVCNYDSMQKNEALTVEFYDKRRAELELKEPNHAHKVVVALKKKYKEDIAVITQNVDNLFEKAGLAHEEVVHLHGYLPQLRCQNPACGLVVEAGYKPQREVFNGKCPTCSTKLRPNIVFFGESAPLYATLYEELEDCELLVVIGTSGYVINTDMFAQHIPKSILNNLEPSDAIDASLYSVVLYKKATEAIDEIRHHIDNLLDSKG